MFIIYISKIYTIGDEKMITPISFGSTYIVTSSNKMPSKHQIGYDTLKKYCDTKWLPYNEKSVYELRQPYGPSTFKLDLIMVVPKNEDKKIEKMAFDKGIGYKKLNTDSLLDSQGIINRVQDEPEGFKKALIDAKKLETLLLKQDYNNFKSIKANYNKEHKKQARFMILSGEKIPASSLFISDLASPNDKNADGTVAQNSLSISILKQTDMPDHCMYFAMRDAGMTEIPVYMNEKSYKLAAELGILKS